MLLPDCPGVDYVASISDATIAMLAVYGDQHRLDCGGDGLVSRHDDGGLRAEGCRASQSGRDRGLSGHWGL